MCKWILAHLCGCGLILLLALFVAYMYVPEEASVPVCLTDKAVVSTTKGYVEMTADGLENWPVYGETAEVLHGQGMVWFGGERAAIIKTYWRS